MEQTGVTMNIIFLPDGKNDVGKLSNMQVKPSLYNREVIERFTGSNEEECCIQDCLKCW